MSIARQLPVPDEAVSSIAPLLQHLSATEASAGNRVYGHCGAVAGDLCWHWTFGEHDQVVYGVEFSNPAVDSDETVIVRWFTDIVGIAETSLEWRRLPDTLRLAAWSEVHHSLIELLRAVTGVDLVATAFVYGDERTACHSDNVTLRFSIRRVDQLTACRGEIELSTRTAERLAVSAPLATERAHWPGLTAAVHCVVDSFSVTPDELLSLEEGAVILLDNTSLASMQPQVLLTAGGSSWAARVFGMRLVVSDDSSTNVPIKLLNSEACDD